MEKEKPGPQDQQTRSKTHTGRETASEGPDESYPFWFDLTLRIGTGVGVGSTLDVASSPRVVDVPVVSVEDSPSTPTSRKRTPPGLVPVRE